MGYWAMEYGKVLIAYIALMYIWPSVVFRKYLAAKSRTYRFAFCSTVQVMLVNTVVLLLGLVHLLNRWTMILVFYGIFIGSILWKRKITGEGLRQIRQVLVGTRGIKLFLLQIFGLLGRKIKQGIQYLWKRTNGHRIEYFLLVVVVVYGMIYFSYSAFVEPSYGTSDMYVHHSWIYGLQEGKIFSGGIYPEGMHCFIYAMNALFGVSVYSSLHFLAGIYVSTLLVSVYCFLKEIMHSRYTGILILTAFLTLDLVSFDAIASMARLQWTLPQEFGLFTMLLGALYLVRYLRGERAARKENGKRKWIVWDENLLIFVLAVAGSIVTHFYVTIMAFFLCIPFAMVGIRQLFHHGNFRSLLSAVIIGIFIAAIPMGAAYATGIPFQGSIGWALNIIKDSGGQEINTEIGPEAAENTDNETEHINFNTQSADSPLSGHNGNINKGIPVQQEISTKEKILKKVSQLGYQLENVANRLYENAYVPLYGDRAKWIVLFTLIGAGIGAVCFLITSMIRRQIVLDGYLGITLATIVFMVAYRPGTVGLPSLIDCTRLCSSEQMLIIAMMLIPIDLFLSVLQFTRGRVILPCLTLLGIGGIYCGTNYFGVYHGYMYISMTRYSAAVEVTKEVSHKFPKNKFTIISPTDELYQTIEYGRHEEIMTLLRNMQDGTYVIPTEYLFFFVEKEPILYAQYHFVTGPNWLANEKYAPLSPSSITSEGKQVIHSEISKESAEQNQMYFSLLSDTYKNFTSRNIIESKMYYWCENLMKKYPDEMNVYYEDDQFICYVLKQNTYRLVSLEKDK